MIRIFLPLVFVFSGCTFMVTGSGAGAEAGASASSKASTSGDIVMEKFNDKGQVIERHRVTGGVGQNTESSAQAEARADAKSTSRSVSALVIVGLAVAAIAAVLGAAELTKLIARLYSGKGL